MPRMMKQTFAQVIPYGNGVYTNAQMIGNVIYSLGEIKVSGKENMDLLLGSILALESVQKSLIEQEKARQEDADGNDEQGEDIQNAVCE